jgi:hypothetical protein
MAPVAGIPTRPDPVVITRLEQLSRRVRVRDNDIEIERVFRLEPYKAYPDAIRYLLGTLQVSSGGGQTPLITPARDPYHPECCCVQVEVLNNQNDTISDALVANNPAIMQMTAVQENFKSGAILRTIWRPKVENNISLDFTAQNLTLPKSVLKFLGHADPNRVLSQQVPGVVVRPEVDILFTKRIPAGLIDMVTLSSFIGRVNGPTPDGNRGPTVLQFGDVENQLKQALEFPLETLQFMGLHSVTPVSTGTVFNGASYNSSPADTPWGVRANFDWWDYTYKFKFKAHFETSIAKFRGTAPPPHPVTNVQTGYFPGWNRFYDPEVSQWDYVVEQADANRKLYQNANEITDGFNIGFNILFGA